jgi:hypothetical protein
MQMLQISAEQSRYRDLAALLAFAMLAGCASVPRETPRRVDAPTTSAATSPTPTRSETLQRLSQETQALMPLATSELGKTFLRATDALPSVSARAVLRDDNSREYFSVAQAEAMPEERRKKLALVELDEYRYYYTKYGTPLAYLRAIDLASANGITRAAGLRVLDFGYGSIGHLRLLASLGASAVGIDPDSYLRALYSSASDQGSVSPARGLYRGRSGDVTLAHGRWPVSADIVSRVSTNGPYQLIISKNTLKRGYIKPERRAPKNQLIDLGVSDDVFLKAVHDALAPGGLLIIYNLAPKQAAADKPFLPQADARSPFSAEQFNKAGLSVIAMNTDDHDFVRLMGAALGWDKNDKGEVVNDLNTNLFALYTIVKRDR